MLGCNFEKEKYESSLNGKEHPGIIEDLGTASPLMEMMSLWQVIL